MPIKWTQVKNPDVFAYQVLEALEAPTPEARHRIHTKIATPTIGIGFDLLMGGKQVRYAVFSGMGFDDKVLASLKQPPADTPQYLEWSYIKKLKLTSADLQLNRT